MIKQIKKHKGLIETTLKTKINNSYDLSLVYTPGVGASCKEIEKDAEKINTLTNRKNSIAVIGVGTEEKLPFVETLCYFYNTTFGFDAYPLVISTNSKEKIELVIQNLTPNFVGFDLSLIEEELKTDKIDVLEIFYKNEKISNLFDFLKSSETLDFKEFETNIKPQIKTAEEINLDGADFKEIAISLRENHQGVMKVQPKFETTDFKTLTKTAEEISELIKQDPQNAYEYTIKGSLVGIISDGSAVLGFGNIGAKAGMPVMEGKAALFKSLGEVNAVSLCVETQNIEEIIEITQLITPTLAGVNLEDINAPRCFEIENRLIETSNIPIFHDDQHGTSIVVLAGFLNALKLTKKNINDIKVVMSGAGAAAQNVAKMLLLAGVKNLILTDKYGVVFKEREIGMDEYLLKMTEITNLENEKGTLKDVLKGADFLIGLSAGNIVSEDMVKSMAENPVIFTLANPTPEIDPNLAKKAGAFIVATGRSDFENQINNSLAFPGLFRGVIKSKGTIKKITKEMKLAAAKAISQMIKEEELAVNNIIPNALDKNVPALISEAVINVSHKAFI